MFIGPYQGGVLFSDANNWKFIWGGTATTSSAGAQIRQTVSTFINTLVSCTASNTYAATLNLSDTDGTQIMTLGVTPSAATTLLRIDVKINGTLQERGTSPNFARFGLFATTATSALDVAWTPAVLATGAPTTANIEYLASSTATTLRTYQVRGFPRSSSGPIFEVNGSGGGVALNGGNSYSSIIIMEY